MKKFEPGQAAVFAIVLLIIGAIIHKSQNTDLPQTDQINHVTPPGQLAPAPQASASVTIVKIWPDGAMPTKIVHIPNLQQPAKGLMEISLYQGDDLELDIDPPWLFQFPTPESFPGAQAMINGGDGFEPLVDYQNRIRNSDQSGTNAFWMKARTIRLRLAPGGRNATYDLTVLKNAVVLPAPPVLPQNYHDLSISYEGIRGLPDRKVLVYLAFRNCSHTSTLGIAMHDQSCPVTPCYLQSSLVASDGTPYVIDTSEITGINGLRTNPHFLTPIEPGEVLNASFKFQPRGVLSQNISSVRLQAEIVLNEHFVEGQYNYFRETGQDVLPPFCKVINVMFDIHFPSNQ